MYVERRKYLLNYINFMKKVFLYVCGQFFTARCKYEKRNIVFFEMELVPFF